MSPPSGLSLAIAAAGAIASAPALAAPVSISHSVTLNTLLQNSSSSLSFDLNSFLASEGFTAAEVLGGSVSVFGFSEASYGAPQYGSDYNTQSYASGAHTAYYSYYVQGYQSCSWWGYYCYYSGGYTAYQQYSITDYTQHSDRDVTRSDSVIDQMQVTVGASMASATVNQTSSSAGPFGQYLYDRTNSNCWYSQYYVCSYTDIYHREREVYSATYGALAVTEALDLTALADLRSDGQLSLLVAASVGQFNLSSISFDLAVKHQIAQQQNSLISSNVPEPRSLPLTALALAAAIVAGGYHRRRRAVR